MPFIDTSSKVRTSDCTRDIAPSAKNNVIFGVATNLASENILLDLVAARDKMFETAAEVARVARNLCTSFGRSN